MGFPTGFKEMAEKQSSSAAVSNVSKYSDTDRKAFEQKDLAMRKMCAMNNSRMTLEAYSKVCASAGVFNGMDKKAIWEWMQGLERGEYMDNCRDLGVTVEETIHHETEIPF